MKRKEEVLAVIDQPNRAEGEVELSQAVSEVERQAQSMVIQSDDQYKKAAEFGRTLKQKSAEVVEFFKPMKKAAHDAHKQICDREKTMLTPIANAEKLLKRAMGAYDLMKMQKAREEEQRLRAIAQAEEERLLAEAIRMEEQGEKEMADENFENAQFVADSARSISVQAEAIKAAGVSSTTDWEIASIAPGMVPVEFMGQVIRPVDEKAVLKLIRAHKGNIEIPGIQFKAVQKISFRK